MDSISGTGFLYVSAATSPSGQEGWLFQRQPTMAGSIETRKGKIQEFHPFNSSQVYTRTCNWDTEVWNPWLRIDNFGCNTASELANLLGVAATFQTDSCTINGVTVTVYKCLKNIIVYFSGTITAAFEEDVFLTSRGTRCSFDLGTPMNNRLWLPIFNGYGQYCGYVSTRPSNYADFYLRLNMDANFGDESVGDSCVSWIAK